MGRFQAGVAFLAWLCRVFVRRSDDPTGPRGRGREEGVEQDCPLCCTLCVMWCVSSQGVVSQLEALRRTVADTASSWVRPLACQPAVGGYPPARPGFSAASQPFRRGHMQQASSSNVNYRGQPPTPGIVNIAVRGPCTFLLLGRGTKKRVVLVYLGNPLFCEGSRIPLHLPSQACTTRASVYGVTANAQQPY